MACKSLIICNSDIMNRTYSILLQGNIAPQLASISSMLLVLIDTGCLTSSV